MVRTHKLHPKSLSSSNAIIDTHTRSLMGKIPREMFLVLDTAVEIPLIFEINAKTDLLQCRTYTGYIEHARGSIFYYAYLRVYP